MIFVNDPVFSVVFTAVASGLVLCRKITVYCEISAASVCGIYFFIGAISACRNKFSIDIFVGEINCIDTKRIRNDALCNYNLISF